MSRLVPISLRSLPRCGFTLDHVKSNAHRILIHYSPVSGSKYIMPSSDYIADRHCIRTPVDGTVHPAPVSTGSLLHHLSLYTTGSCSCISAPKPRHSEIRTHLHRAYEATSPFRFEHGPSRSLPKAVRHIRCFLGRYGVLLKIMSRIEMHSHNKYTLYTACGRSDFLV
jgi:hypothetical protein